MKTAYLYGELEDKVYMDVPEGLEDMPENHVLKLEKALYRLKQVGQQWYHKLSGVMDKFGMKHVKSDPHTFMTTKVVRGKKLTLIIPIYVDDLFPFGDKPLVNEFEQYITQYFETSIPCNIHYFLGICVTQNHIWTETTPYIALDQIQFVQNLIGSISGLFSSPPWPVTDWKTVLPADPIIINEEPREDADPLYVKRFQSTVGQLMYAMLATRLDISYTIGMLAHNTVNPSSKHKDALFHLLGYLQWSQDDALVYRPNNPEEIGAMDCYTDVDWVGEIHSRHSTSGMAIYKNSSLISWHSKWQGCISTSTMESEYVAMYVTVQQAVWLSSLEEEFGLTEICIPNIYCDNQVAIAVATREETTKLWRSRAMNIKFNYVHFAYEKKEIIVQYIESENNIADIFTNWVPKNVLKGLKDYFMEAYSEREFATDMDSGSGSSSE